MSSLDYMSDFIRGIAITARSRAVVVASALSLTFGLSLIGVLQRLNKLDRLSLAVGFAAIVPFLAILLYAAFLLYREQRRIVSTIESGSGIRLTEDRLHKHWERLQLFARTMPPSSLQVGEAHTLATALFQHCPELKILNDRCSVTRSDEHSAWDSVQARIQGEVTAHRLGRGATHILESDASNWMYHERFLFPDELQWLPERGARLASGNEVYVLEAGEGEPEAEAKQEEFLTLRRSLPTWAELREARRSAIRNHDATDEFIRERDKVSNLAALESDCFLCNPTRTV
jgi:hypothetical protein